MAKSKSAREKAFSKPGTGNAAPGALSKAKTGGGNNQSVMPSIPSSLTQPQPQQPAPNQTDLNQQTPLFAAKLAEAQHTVDVLPAQPTGGLQFGKAEQVQPLNAAPPSNETLAPKKEGILDKVKNALTPTVRGPVDEFGNPPPLTGEQKIIGAWQSLVTGFIGTGLAPANEIKAVAGITKASVKPGVIKSTAGATTQSTVKTQTMFEAFFARGVKNVQAGKGTIEAWTVTKTVGFLATLATAMYGGKNFSEFLGSEEASQAAGICIGMANNAKDYANYLKCRELQKEALDFESNLIPIKNVADGIAKGRSIVSRVGEIMDDIQANKQKAIASGTTESEIAAQTKAAREKASVDYYNAKRLETEQQIAALKAQESEEFNAGRIATEKEIQRIRSASDRAAQKKANDELLTFLREQQARLDAEQREEEEAMRKYWLEYNKLNAKLSEESRPSKLGFGLFR